MTRIVATRIWGGPTSGWSPKWQRKFDWTSGPGRAVISRVEGATPLLLSLPERGWGTRGMGGWHGRCGLQCVRGVSNPGHVSGPLISAGRPNLLQPAPVRQTATLAVPAAQYVRMSTEHQQYSTENQADAIREYADAAGLRDRPHLRRRRQERPAARRPGRAAAADRRRPERRRRLQGDPRLRRQPLGPVSGRRRERLLRVHLPARPASRSTTAPSSSRTTAVPASTIIKSVKRAMAGEYSRELSAKVFAGQCRLIELGFRQGGPAGLRPAPAAGRPERRAEGDARPRRAQEPADRPRRPRARARPRRSRSVRRMYRLFVDEGRSRAEIADILNDEGLTHRSAAGRGPEAPSTRS